VKEVTKDLMNSQKRKGKPSFRRRGRGRGGVVGYRDTGCTHTFSQAIFFGLTGGIGTTTFNWQDLTGFTDLAEFYAYFKPLSYKIEVPNIGTGVVLPGTMGMRPINWIVDLPLSIPTITNGMILEQRGHITGQVGASNLGRWSSWPPNQQQLNSLLSLTEPAAVLLAAGAGTASGVVYNVSITIHFYRRGIFSVAPSLADVEIIRASGVSAEEKLIMHAQRIESKRLVPLVRLTKDTEVSKPPVMDSTEEEKEESVAITNCKPLCNPVTLPAQTGTCCKGHHSHGDVMIL